MEKAQEYKYYSTQRPVDIGTFPNGKENPPIRIENYEGRIWVEHDTRLAWGELAYAQPLTEKELYNYELKYIIPKTAPNHKDVTRSAHFRAARSVLAEHGIKPRLDLPLALVPHLGGENGGQVFNGNRPALERGRFHFLVVAGPRFCHDLPSYKRLRNASISMDFFAKKESVCASWIPANILSRKKHGIARQ